MFKQISPSPRQSEINGLFINTCHTAQIEKKAQGPCCFRLGGSCRDDTIEKGSDNQTDAYYGTCVQATMVLQALAACLSYKEEVRL